MNNHRLIYVYADWEGLKVPHLMGVLESQRVRGKEVFSFEYEKEWLQNEAAQFLDPDLYLFEGRQFLPYEKPNFGLFTDSSPDRWGRVLMQRREAAIARKESRPIPSLFESDYLLGVYDEFRMGALRFKLDPDGPFLSNDTELSAPPWARIRSLEEISLELEKDNAVNNPEYLKWLNVLIAPGSSIGGARPKAAVVDEQNHPWIAKFPSKNDDQDIGAWEMVVQILAGKAGVLMAPAKVQCFSSRYHKFITKRFDRTESGNRLHFASAMTLLGYTDGDNAHDGVSYLELAQFISDQGSNIKPDLEQLWRRIVFSLCVKNTDDHLRNHGFLLESNGWRLSPAYDLNPNETGNGLSLNISEHDNSLDFNLAMEVSPYFRLSKQCAQKIIQEVKATVRSWREVASQLKIAASEQEMKARAFELAFDD